MKNNVDLNYVVGIMKDKYLRVPSTNSPISTSVTTFPIGRAAGTLIDNKLGVGIALHRDRMYSLNHNVYIPFLMYNRYRVRLSIVDKL